MFVVAVAMCYDVLFACVILLGTSRGKWEAFDLEALHPKTLAINMIMIKNTVQGNDTSRFLSNAVIFGFKTSRLSFYVELFATNAERKRRVSNCLHL